MNLATAWATLAIGSMVFAYYAFGFAYKAKKRTMKYLVENTVLRVKLERKRKIEFSKN